MLASLLLGTLLALAPTPASSQGIISGTIVNSKTEQPIEGALVILQCACLQGARETQTNARGLYAFRGLPAGVYTVQVLVGQADVAKIVELPATES